MTWLPHIEFTMNLGQVVLTGALGFVWWAIRKVVRGFTLHMQRITHLEDRLEASAEVVDEHSDVIIRAGWMKGKGRWKKLSQNRRMTDDV